MMWEGGGESPPPAAPEGGGCSVAAGGGGRKPPEEGRSSGGGGRRKPSWREKENNRRRERRRRAIAANIFNGLRSQGDYDLPKHCDNNEVLKALCKEAGWVVLPDGTTFRRGCKPPPSTVATRGRSTNTTPCSSQKPSPLSSSFPSPVPSYQCSPTRLDTTTAPSANPFEFLCNSTPPLPPLQISSSAPGTPPLPKVPNLNTGSFNLQSLACSVPTSPTRMPATTISECDESYWSTCDSFQRMRFQDCDPMMISPSSPTFNLVNPMAQAGAKNNAIMERVKAWKGERFHNVGFDDLELTLGSANA